MRPPHGLQNIWAPEALPGSFLTAAGLHVAASGRSTFQKQGPRANSGLKSLPAAAHR